MNKELEKIQQIINNLKQISTVKKVYTREYPWISNYHRKAIQIIFQIQGNQEENEVFYEAEKEEIDNLRKEKTDQELFALLIEKQLQGVKDHNSKDFQTPCPYCQQSTLNVRIWSTEGLPETIKRLYCRFCQLSMPYFELAQDPLETQKELMNYEIVIRKNEIEQDGKKLFSLLEKQDQIETRIRRNKEIIRKYEI